MVSLSHVSFAPLCDDEGMARIVDVRFYKPHVCAVLVQYTTTTVTAIPPPSSSQTIATPLRSTSKNTIGSTPATLTVPASSSSISSSSTTSSPLSLSSGVVSPMFHTPTGTGTLTSKSATPVSSTRGSTHALGSGAHVDELMRALHATSAPVSSSSGSGSGSGVRMVRSRLWLIPYGDEHVTSATIGMHQLSSVTSVTSLVDQLPPVPVHTIAHARQRSLPHIIVCVGAIPYSTPPSCYVCDHGLISMWCVTTLIGMWYECE